MRNLVKILSVSCIAFTLTSCMSAAAHRDAIKDTGSDQLTVGTVQREIKVGMMSSEVITVMGSPNIVTTDEKRREVWVYDKIATDHVYSSSSGGVSTLILGGGGSFVGAGVGAGGNQSAGASSTSQRTLTVVIKFDEESKVRDFAYHTTRF